MTKIAPRKVTLNGLHLWALRHAPGEDYALAPPSHCDAHGNVTREAGLLGTSYAHVQPPAIMRYGQMIGQESDLKEGWQV